MRFLQVDVFADAAYAGNPLAVFPDGGSLTDAQMQSIASEMSLSETTFVTRADANSYDVKIFTPVEQLPFAGHPTLGTAWVLRHLGILSADETVQRCGGSDTPLQWREGMFWFERTPSEAPGLVPEAARVADTLGLREKHIGFDASVLGGGDRPLMPAFSDAGIPQLMVPLRDANILAAAEPQYALGRLSHHGVYCFAPAPEPATIRARGFFPGLGIAEDPGTGSAAAALGLYLAERVGPIDVTVQQGVELGRPSRIHVDAEPGRSRIGGRCVLVLEGELATLP